MTGPAESFSQTAIAHFFDAATSAQRGESASAYQSAMSAYNIISNTPSPITADGIHGVSAPVGHALLHAFARYLPDMARSAEANPSPIQKKDGVFVIGVSQQSLRNLMQQISLNKSDFGQMQAMSSLAIGTSVGAQVKHVTIPGLSNPVTAFGDLYALGSAASGDVGIAKGAQLDLQHQAWNEWISAGIGAFGNASFDSATLGGAQVLSALAGPLIPQFSTDNAASAVSAEEDQEADNEFNVEVPLVQGLASTGALPSPPPPGRFTATGEPDHAFSDWWDDTGAGLVPGGKSEDGNLANLKTLQDWVDTATDAMSRTQGKDGPR